MEDSVNRTIHTLPITRSEPAAGEPIGTSVDETATSWGVVPRVVIALAGTAVVGLTAMMVMRRRNGMMDGTTNISEMTRGPAPGRPWNSSLDSRESGMAA